ncbi:hypothetical protein PVIIG_03174 [Plasmodium vivax India VII]|uniref:tRNA:m(4)X modification enzyme TRM13 n=1 Tax=Plasmodium vivax India VII TaxID=1077284 RepID=A0A0J9SBG0_PLAVI|nr:hypothetical protein PVIIG_03174 [Plasmodium vivax India VII]
MTKPLFKTAFQNRSSKPLDNAEGGGANMQDVCPLERNSFPRDDSVGRTKEVVKHLKKCPLFLKALYLHYNPFCFPSINDTSSCLIDKGDVEAELRRYHVAFNETILHVLKKKITITSFDQFRILKHKIIFEQFLNHGMDQLMCKLADDDFVRALQGEEAVERPTGVRPTGEWPTGEPPVEDPLLSTANQFLDGHIAAVKKRIYHLRESPHGQNGKDASANAQLGGASSLCRSTEAEEGNICGSHGGDADGVDANGRGSTPREKHPLPILTLQSIGNIHKYRLCRELLHFIDKEVFPVSRKNEEEHIDEADTNTDEQLIEEENLNRDEVMSIVIYTVIYLCCKMSIIKRLKNKNFDHKNYLNSSGEKSIFFFLENLDKHDLQNVNMMFLLLHFNSNLLGIFERMFSQRGWDRREGTSLRDYLFIELGAGKANTTRWVKFIMDDLVDILERFFSPTRQRGGGGDAERAALLGGVSGQAEERSPHPMERSPEPLKPLNPRERCKLLIIERESLRNKKEKKNFLMQMAPEKNQHMMRVKADISDFHLLKFIYFSENGLQGEGGFSEFVPDIIQFYYYKGVYRWKRYDQRGEQRYDQRGEQRYDQRGEQRYDQRDDQRDNQRDNLRPNDEAAPITEAFLRNSLSQLGTYFDVHVRKLLSFLTQGNNNLLRVYDDMNNFLRNFDCKKVTFLTKHLCGNGTDLALRMLVNNTKRRDKENYFILAPCCHHRFEEKTKRFAFNSQFRHSDPHRCDVHKILGFKLLTELGIDQAHLQHVVRHMSGYASCDNPVKKTIGKKVKLLVDLARILHLLEGGLQHVYLVKYVKRSVTLENHAIVFFNHRQLDLRMFGHF